MMAMFDEFLHESFGERELCLFYHAPRSRQSNPVLDQEERDSRALYVGSKESTPIVGDEPPDVGTDSNVGKDGQGRKKNQQQKKQQKKGSSSAGPSSGEDKQVEAEEVTLNKRLVKTGLVGGTNIPNNMTRYTYCLYLCTGA
jgi:hypothetical protein